MKKLFTFITIVAVLSLLCTNAHAQIAKPITPTKTSLSATDTATAAIAAISSDGTLVSVEIDATKTSGTVGGKVYFIGVWPNGTTETKLDSMTVANSAGLQNKLITVATPFIYRSYKLQYLSTGGVWVPGGYTLKRN